MLLLAAPPVLILFLLRQFRLLRLGKTTHMTTPLASSDIQSEIVLHRMSNGMTVIVQPMPWLRSAAFTLSFPAGICQESADRAGIASMTCEMVQRGAGSYSSRDLVAAQDNLGLDRNSGVLTNVVSYGAAMPAESFDQALGVYADILRRPHLPADQLDDARMMMMQELRAIEDEPSHRVMRRIRQMRYGDRLGRGPQGTMESLQTISQDDVREFFQTYYQANGAVLTVAGNVQPKQIIATAEAEFGDWKSGDKAVQYEAESCPGYDSIEMETSQTHIAFGFPCIPYGHERYFKMRAGIGILSDGMSSRLFDRVREQRGLCYTVSASCHSLPNAATVFGYAGTTPERAQETLDVTLHEVKHLVDDLQQSELDRWKVRIESALVMEQESSASRASSLASDFFQLGRPLETKALSELIEAITLKDVQEYWTENPPQDFHVVTLGPQPLTVNL
ncbi:Peptidase M16 inactive domain protein [Stieleria bergensis]|uniref:Peptidase M16 inactive domain protein n=2 Tax=Stieleria bergensis TaxID=2528025 RepID=A0A517T0G3_9BACT|nr:Peptidase M16 inactive domain protein [Planctomycetes bacterium SV_7m_r]